MERYGVDGQGKKRLYRLGVARHGKHRTGMVVKGADG